MQQTGDSVFENYLPIEQPTILEELQNILSKYPDGAQILREMVQNAEDAGATCMKILYDNRAIDPGGNPRIQKYFRGPGVCIFNDARFSDKDWLGIRKIYSSNKRGEPLKIGRFGLGFKSIFHLTDYAVIISGDKLLIMDPLKSEQKLGEECLIVNLEEIKDEPLIKETLTCMIGKFGFDSTTLQTAFYDGTLFWFPLRQSASALNQTVYTSKRVEHLFSSFTQEASYIPLFLRSLEKIEIYDWDDSEPMLTVQMYGSDSENFRQERNTFRCALHELDRSKKLPVDNIYSKLEFVIKTTRRIDKGNQELPTITQNEWTVVSCFVGTNDMSRDVQLLTRDPDIPGTLYTGVAFCTNSGLDQRSSGHIFCFLPIPFTDESLTGLPVHVNAFFSLEDNRRHLKFGTTGDRTDNSALWNDTIIKDFLPQVYLILTKDIREKSEKNGNTPNLVRDFHDSIPDPDNVKEDWRPLLSNLYERLLLEPIFYTTNNGGLWVRLPDALINMFNEERDIFSHTLEIFLLDCRKNFVTIPLHMKRVLEYTMSDKNEISPKMVRDNLKNSTCWKNYTNSQKVDLLSFILQDGNWGDLGGIELLPLDNGTFTTFSTTVQAEDIYVLNEEYADLFPGLGSRLVSPAYISKIIWTDLSSMAEKGMFQLKPLTDRIIPDMLTLTFNSQCTQENGRFIPKTNSPLNISWIHSVWKNISMKSYEDIHPFENVLLIPILEMDRDGSRVNDEEQQTNILEFLTLKGNYMLTMYKDQSNLSPSMQKLVEMTGIRMILPEETIKFPYPDVIGHYIQLPTPANVLHCFQGSYRRGQDIADDINQLQNEESRLELLQYLSDHTSDIPGMSFNGLKSLKLFRQSDNLGNTELVSLEENNNMMGNFPFPMGIEYPHKLIMSEQNELVRRLGGLEIDENRILAETLDLMLTSSAYSTGDKRKLLVHIKDRPANIKDEVWQKAKQLQCIPSSDGNDYRIKDLFDPSSKLLQQLFYGDEGIFPDKHFVSENNFEPELNKLGIKREDNVTSENLLHVARSIHHNCNSEDMDSNRVKANAFVTYVLQYPCTMTEEDMGKIRHLKWVPCIADKPDGYPDTLSWFHSKRLLCSPNDVKSITFKYLVGSVTSLVSCVPDSSSFAQFYKWACKPELGLVTQQLELVIESYTACENSDYIRLAKYIFEYLNEQKKQTGFSDRCQIKLTSLRCVPTSNQGFKPIAVTFIKSQTSHINYSLDPYIFELANEMNIFNDMFIDLGVKPVPDFETLENVLKQINDKHNSVTHGNYTVAEIERDMSHVVNILKSVVAMENDKSKLRRLLIPIAIPDQYDITLSFDSVENCTYAPLKPMSAFVQKMNGDDEVIYVHPDINDLAPQLGVASVTKRVLNPDSILLPWGQSEPLTTSIANCLDDYKDGLTIPKELIQNADDAGASEVCFLFDERTNLEWRDGLIDEGMAEIQGKALWVYNNALFHEKDFENILRLGGKTKLQEKDKIGKFGLGFCSVYNVTDVPCFVSGNNLVILDPHLYHLGEAVQNNVPGLRVSITDKFLRNFRNQFKPFDNVFGCTMEGAPCTNVKGTLFRLPLRTQKQAERSLIKRVQYTKREVLELIEKIIDTAANMLLFTQNVTKVSVYHLESDSTDPDNDKKLIFSTEKSFLPENIADDWNILKNVVTFSTQNNTNEQLHLPVKMIRIQYEITENAQVLSCDFKSSKVNQCWLLSWDISGHEELKCDRNPQNDGAIPIGTIATPVDIDEHEIITLLELDKLPKGFYSKGHVFCFLPLPQTTNLPVHLNGLFIVEQSRKSLVHFNEDDKSNDGISWNKTIFCEAIMSAYIKLLEFIASKINSKSQETNYWKIWPSLNDNLPDTEELTFAVYKYIAEKNPIVFYRKDYRVNTFIKSSIKNTVFLDPEFRNRSDVGKIALDFLLTVNNESGVVIMDMPIEVFENFCKSNTSIKNRIISKKDFFEKYFFPQINDGYWQKDGMTERRDKLVLIALDDEDLHYLIETTSCILAQSSDVLNKPSDLVLEKGLVGDMFDIQDGRFPLHSFDQHRETLIKLGLMVNTISTQLLADRIYTVTQLSKRNYKKALDRSLAIMKYLNEGIENHNDLGVNIRNIPFLPIMSKPAEWHPELPWKGSEDGNYTRFMCPSEIFSPYDKELIGSVRPVLDSIKSDERVLRLIGIPEVDIENVVDQLEVIGKIEFQSTEGLEDICDRLYTTLNTCLESKEAGCYCLISQLENLKLYRIVLSNSELIQPFKVALYIDGDCTPYLYGMNYRFQRYKQLWQILGVPDHFDITTYLAVLKQKREDTHEQNMTVDEDEVHIIINVLKNICTTLKSECMELTAEDKKDLFIPDTARVLRPINDICFDDGYYGLVHENCQLHFIHEEVKNEFGMIEALGIMSKRHLHLSRFPPFGQKEKLVTRIKDILDSYPLEHSVLNELLQNADDAGATEVHFVLDMRCHGTDHIFGDQWMPFQGPALCVFNDTCFSTKDLEKIQQLGKGSKMNDPSKTGQFGVGFNAVYHLTDVPSFLTRGESTPNGGTFCVFDPHCKYVPKAEIDAPGLQINNLLILENNYSDVYSTYLQRELSAETGTWFRFPLRTKEMAESSEIRNSTISEQQIKRILDRMKHKMKESLLFLDKVRKISVSYIHRNGNELSDTSSTTLSVSPEYETDVLNFTHHVKRQLKLLKSGHEYINSMELKEIQYEALTNDTSGDIDTWLIVQTFGFVRPSTIPNELIEAYSEGRIHLSPRGGTAKCIKSINRKMKSEVSTHCNKGIAFCFLPLPTETGLPVHINGHFALSQNRRHIFSGKDENDVRDIWNKCIVEHTVGPSYAAWLTFAKTVLVHSSDKMHLTLASFFNTFPIFGDAKDDFWRRLTCATFVEIHDNELNIFPICHSYVKCRQCPEQPICTPLTWIALNHCDSGCNFPAVFEDLGQYFQPTRRETSTLCTCEEQHNLRTVLINIGMKIICNPLDIFRSINASCKMLGCHKNKKKSKENVDNLEQQMSTKCICATLLSPESTVQFLKSWNTHALDKCLLNPTKMDLTDSPFKTIELLNSVIGFCLQSKNLTIENLIGTPLLVTNNNKLMTIGQNNDLWLSKFCSIFFGSSEFFVHHDQVTVFEEFKDHFKQLDLSICKEMLPATVDKLLYKETNPLCWNTADLFPNEQWLVDFWEYLNSEDNVKGYFDELCLFPTIWIDGSHKLVSFSLAFTVYYVEVDENSSNHHHNSLQDLMIKLQLPTPNSDICGKKHLQDLAATDGSPEKLLECLCYHLNNIKWEHLDSNECCRLLRYFSDSASYISSSVISKLKSIPLFVNVWNEPVTLASTNTVLIIKSENMTVYEGLREMCERTKTNLISFNPDHEAIYKKLVCTLCYPVGKRHRHPLLSVYTMFILPNFGIITQDARLKHLVFIRDELLQYEEMKLHICHLEFIQSEDTILRKACEFFSPQHNIIQELCLPSQLPPTPFCEQEWMEFMEIAGMQCEVNAQLFIKFAKEIQLIGLTEKNIRHSELLFKHMFSSKELYEDQRFLSSISSINFIAPLKIPEEYSTICKPHNSNKLLTFKEGVMSRNIGLCWTMLDILPEFDVPTTTNTDVLKHLKVIDNPLDLKLNCVISHVHNVCESLSHKKRKDKKVVQHIIPMFYEYFSTLSKEEKNELKVRLEQTPIIYSIEHDMLLPAANVILELPISMEIKPYLVKCSEMYGSYFDLFRILGVSKNITIIHFFTVSMFIKKIAGILPLTPDEMKCIQLVINGVFDSLHRGNSEDLMAAENVVFYLPNEKGILKASNQLTFNDDFHHRDRLGAENCNEFIVVDMDHIGSFLDLPSLLKRLPERLRPKLLSESVKEIVLHRQNTLASDLAVTLEAFISGDIFSHVIARLIKTWQMTRRKHVGKDVLDHIQYKLKSLRVMTIANLETVLCNEGIPVNSTVRTRSIFYDMDDNIMYARFKESVTDSWMSKNSIWISLAIKNICLGKVRTYHIQSVLPYFEASIEEIDEVMNDHNIVDIEYEFVDRRWNSVPGQYVPESLYDCLCSELSEFEPGDHAVYEVCDNISELFDAKNQLYICVKIVKKISDDSESFPFYLINTGDEGDIEARSHRLYKVIRTPCVSTTEVDKYTEQQIDTSLVRSEIYQTVEETLVDAWRLGQEEFKIVLRRLILHWHPDKNKNSSFCGDVFMHITAFVKRLQSGEIDVSKINKYRDRGTHQWQEEMKRATGATSEENEEYVFDVGDFADKVRQRNDRRHGNEQNEWNYTLPNPQPDRGKVWIRQAKDDLAAAKTSLITATDRTYNWVCVQSHQAAEKAIKSIQIVEDANKIGNDHFLTNSVSDRNPIIQDAARELEMIAVRYSRMRYPYVTLYPKTPSELYTQQDAEEAVRLATLIVDTVNDQYFNRH